MATTILPIRLHARLLRVGLPALLGCAPCAALEISLLPETLREGEPAFVELDDRGDCRAPLPGSLSPRLRGDVLEVEIALQDYCDPRLPGELRRLPLGVLPAALSEVRVFTCVANAPPGADPCRLHLQSAVLPGGGVAPVPQPVPIGPALPGLSLGLLAFGLHRLRRR